MRRGILGGCIWLMAAGASAEDVSLSYSFFGMGQERPFYSESLSNFGGQSFKSEFESSGLIQSSGGYTQVTPTWGFEIITSSTLLPEETEETWQFTGFGVVQTDNTTLSQNTLTINGIHFPFSDGQKLVFGIRYQNIAFSRFNFDGTDNTDALNDALLAPGNDPEYDRLLAIVEAFVADVNNDPENGIPDPDNANALIVDDQGRLITSVAELKAAKGLDPSTQQGVIFEDASTIALMVGYAFDSYFEQADEGWRWRAGLNIGLPLYLSVLNTNNNLTLTETLPSGYDMTVYGGGGYQFSKEIGVLLVVEYVYSERGKLQKDNVFLPDNEFSSVNTLAQVYWAF